jgi:glycine/D-amino acid oxidase-like deaminating enzyme
VDDPTPAGLGAPLPSARSDVVIIGGGLMGAASALSLSRRGHRVDLFEARTRGHRAGSSHGSSRAFRHLYAQRHYVEMAVMARKLWEELERLADTRLLTVTGGLEHGAPVRIGQLDTALDEVGVAHEILSAGEATSRWPHMRFETDVLFTPEAAVIDPELAISEMLRLARERGARVHFETPVMAVEPSEGGVTVVTAVGPVAAEMAVVAAGPWLPQLLGGVVDLPPLTVTQQQVFHFTRRAGHDAGTWPVVVFRGEPFAYALPGGRDGGAERNMKVAEHSPGAVTTAGARGGRIDTDGRRRVVGHVRDR